MDAVSSFVLRELQRRVHIADFFLHQLLAQINQKPIESCGAAVAATNSFFLFRASTGRPSKRVIRTSSST